MARREKKRSRAQIVADRLRPGRPPMPAAERKSVMVLVRMTEAEQAHLKALAATAGLSLAALIMRPWREEQ